LRVPFRSLLTLLLRPPTVAIHDDGDVTR
jgi:hypothetical protein